MEDCYYFLYSKCKKNPCEYRHSHAAKENPILCKKWKQKMICTIECPFRHSSYHLNKKRHEMECFWEKSVGCTKEKCEFRHLDSKKDLWKEARILTLEEIIEKKNKERSYENNDDKNEINNVKGDISKYNENENENKNFIEENESKNYIEENTSKVNDFKKNIISVEEKLNKNTENYKLYHKENNENQSIYNFFNETQNSSNIYANFNTNESLFYNNSNQNDMSMFFNRKKEIFDNNQTNFNNSISDQIKTLDEEKIFFDHNAKNNEMNYSNNDNERKKKFNQENTNELKYSVIDNIKNNNNINYLNDDIANTSKNLNLDVNSDKSLYSKINDETIDFNCKVNRNLDENQFLHEKEIYIDNTNSNTSLCNSSEPIFLNNKISKNEECVTENFNNDKIKDKKNSIAMPLIFDEESLENQSFQLLERIKEGRKRKITLEDVRNKRVKWQDKIDFMKSKILGTENKAKRLSVIKIENFFDDIESKISKDV